MFSLAVFSVILRNCSEQPEALAAELLCAGGTRLATTEAERRPYENVDLAGNGRFCMRSIARCVSVQDGF